MVSLQHIDTNSGTFGENVRGKACAIGLLIKHRHFLHIDSKMFVYSFFKLHSRSVKEYIAFCYIMYPEVAKKQQ